MGNHVNFQFLRIPITFQVKIYQKIVQKLPIQNFQTSVKIINLNIIAFNESWYYFTIINLSAKVTNNVILVILRKRKYQRKKKPKFCKKLETHFFCRTEHTQKSAL